MDRKNYFYADEEAIHYDLLASLTERSYFAVHESVAELLDHHLASVDESQCAGFPVLDLGAGTGIGGVNVLSRWEATRLVAFDRSAAMLEVFREKIAARADWNARTRFVLGDFTDPEDCHPERLLRPLAGWPDLPDKLHYGAVVSVYALHHLTSSQKAALYATVHGLLSPGGVFINGDLFAYRTGHLARWAQNDVEQWLVTHLDGAAGEPTHPAHPLKPKLADLKEQWLRHLREENIPLAVSDDSADDGRAATGETEAALLRRAGFREVECVFRRFQSGVIWARK